LVNNLRREITQWSLKQANSGNPTMPDFQALSNQPHHISQASLYPPNEPTPTKAYPHRDDHLVTVDDESEKY
jgi:hypothetical protein